MMGTTASDLSKPLHDGRKVTREEYLELEYDGFKYDMVDGVLRLTPSGFSDHGGSQARITTDLGIFLRNRPAGKIFLETDVFLPDGGDVLRPDLSFVANDRLRIVDKFIMGAPDLIVEILSSRTARRDLGEKADRYLSNKVREYWIVDPRDKSIQVWNNNKEAWRKRKGETLNSELLLGFQVRAAEIFG